jgi:hypothetical protein
MRYAKKPTKIGKSERNEKHAYFPRKTHKNTENMRKTRENSGFCKMQHRPGWWAGGRVLPAKSTGSLHGEQPQKNVF